MAKKLYAYAPNGSPIKATYEYVPGGALAIVSKSPATGEIEIEHQGETEMYWDDTFTVLWDSKERFVHPFRKDEAQDPESAERVFVAEDGELWRESQLVWEETIPDGVPDDPEEAGDDGEG